MNPLRQNTALTGAVGPPSERSRGLKWGDYKAGEKMGIRALVSAGGGNFGRGQTTPKNWGAPKNGAKRRWSRGKGGKE